MSNRYNDEWLAAAQEQLTEAIEDRNFSFALDIIKDIEDAGFLRVSKEARRLLVLAEQE